MKPTIVSMATYFLNIVPDDKNIVTLLKRDIYVQGPNYC